MIAPPFSANPLEALWGAGFALLAPAALQSEAGCDRAALDALKPSWQRLPPDRHLRDGGAYRHRRHASYVLELAADRLLLQPPRAHWQPTDYNALHGGIERWFEPIEAELDAAAGWQALLRAHGHLFARAAAARGAPLERWFIEAHQFRIDTAQGIGRPTPEGAHRDGVDFVAVILVERHAVLGGETRVFDAHGPQGIRFLLEQSWSALLMDDARVIHETTPVQPMDGRGRGWRDTLVLTYRRGGFMAPA